MTIQEEGREGRRGVSAFINHCPQLMFEMLPLDREMRVALKRDTRSSDNI